MNEYSRLQAAQRAEGKWAGMNRTRPVRRRLLLSRVKQLHIYIYKRFFYRNLLEASCCLRRPWFKVFLGRLPGRSGDPIYVLCFNNFLRLVTHMYKDLHPYLCPMCVPCPVTRSPCPWFVLFDHEAPLCCFLRFLRLGFAELLGSVCL